MATFTFDGSASQTINFNVGVDRIIFDLNAEDLAFISEDRSTNVVTVTSVTGAVLTLTNTNLAAITAGAAGGMNNFVPGIDSDIVFDIGTRSADDDLTGNVVIGLEGGDTITTNVLSGDVTRPGALLIGNQGNDTISNDASQFSVRMFGGQGNDTLDLATDNGSDASFLVGGLGSDVILVNSDATLGLGGAVTGVDAGDEAYEGSVTVFGGNGAADANDGADRIGVTLAASGSAEIFGNGGDDSITVFGTGSASVFGGAGTDTLTVTAQNATIFGGIGTDNITVTAAGEGVGEFLVYGGNGSSDAADGRDVITLNLRQNDVATVFGNGGNDTILLANDVDATVSVFGGQGNDSITGSIGQDSEVFGGLGNDVINVTVENNVPTSAEEDAGVVAVGSNVTIYGGNGSADADDGADRITVALTGDARGTEATLAQSAEVFGNGGNDSITLTGQGEATVFGGAGNDTISVDDGLYTVFGGAGEDRFTFASEGVNGVNGGAEVSGNTVAADISFIADLNFDQDELDLGVNVTTVIDATANAATGATLSVAAVTAFNAATSQIADNIEAAVIFTYRGEEYLVQAAVDRGTAASGTEGEPDFVAADPAGIVAGEIASLIRVTGFTGTADANDFVVA